MAIETGFGEPKNVAVTSIRNTPVRDSIIHVEKTAKNSTGTKPKKDATKLTQEWTLKTLTSLGFKQADSEIYLLLTKNGSQKARNIAKTLKTQRRQVYRSLQNLQTKGIVNASTERPAQFSAVSFEKVLDELIKSNREEAKRIEKNKNELLTKWQTLIRESS